MTGRIVRHKDDDTKPLFNFPLVSSYSDCTDRIMCLSERDFNIILNALYPVEQMQTRVYTSSLGNSLYEVVGDEDFETFQRYISDIRTNLGGYMACNEYLERIAIALEGMVQAQDQQTIDIFDVLEALGLEGSEETEDLIEALTYITGLLPGLPTFKIPRTDFLKSIGEMRFRGGIINLLQDIAISQRGQTVAQGGIDMVGVFDLMGSVEDKLLLASGYAGKAIWLWKRIAPSNVPGWFSWITTLTGQLLGSIRAATYDVVEAIENLDLSEIAQAIQDQTVSVSVNCAGCGAEAIEDILSDPEIPDGAFVPTDSTWGGGSSPPESEYVEWAETENDSTTRCKAAEFVIDWLRSLFNRNEWALSVQDTAETLATKMALIFSTADFILFPITASITFITWVIAGLITTGNTFLQEIADELDAHYEELVCELVAGTTIAAGAANVRAYLEANSTLTSFQLNALDVFLKLVNVGGLLYYINNDTATIIGEFPGTCTCGGTALFQVVTTICSGTVTDGDFSEGTLTTIDSCEGNFFGTIRAGMNLAGYPNAETPNRRVEFVSVTGSGTFYVTLVDENVPQASTVESAASLSAFDVEVTGIQITRPDASDTNPFEIQIRVYELV